MQVGVATSPPYVAYLPAGRATAGDHLVSVWTNEGNGRRTAGGENQVTVTPDTTMQLVGVTDGASVTGTQGLTATWSLAPGMDPATAYVQFSIGTADDYDVDGSPWTGSVDTADTAPGPAFVQAFGFASSPDSSTSQYNASPVLLVFVH